MMTLYSRAVDARSHRVRLVLAEKALATRIVETDLVRPPEDLIDLNPYQTVPTLVDRDVVVYEQIIQLARSPVSETSIAPRMARSM